MTLDRISEELSPILSHGDAMTVAQNIQARVLKIFSILVTIRKSDCIGDFINENIADAELPLQRDQSHKSHLLLSNGRRVQSTHDWYIESRERFLSKQHRMNPITLDMDRENFRYLVRHVDLDPKAVLPFTRKTKLRLTGGYSTFSSVDIHPQCHKFKGGVLGQVSKTRHVMFDRLIK